MEQLSTCVEEMYLDQEIIIQAVESTACQGARARAREAVGLTISEGRQSHKGEKVMGHVPTLHVLF